MKTCKKGHNMDGNSDWFQDRGTIRRQCAQCRREQQNSRNERKRLARATASAKCYVVMRHNMPMDVYAVYEEACADIQKSGGVVKECPFMPKISRERRLP